MGLKSNAGKVRRKVIVRGKKKTYSRTMMVRAQNLGMKAMHKELKQERLDKRNVPMEKSLLARALGSLRSKVARKTEGRMYSMNHDGPNAGSTHSLLAWRTSLWASSFRADAERTTGADFGTREHAAVRRSAGESSVDFNSGMYMPRSYGRQREHEARRRDLARAFDVPERYVR